MKTRINAIEINQLTNGDGLPVLVFMHYFGGSSLEWAEVVSRLSKDYRCITFDLRGHGDSEAPDSGYSVDDMTDDLTGIVRQYDLTDYVVIAHSLSGKVALNFAGRQPAGLRKLILVSPSPPKPEPIPDDDRQTMLERHGQPAYAEQMLEQITAKPLSGILHQQIINDNLRTSTVAWTAWLKQGSLEDIADRMQDITVPVSIVVGTGDESIAPDTQHKLTLPFLKDATFDTLDGGGHLLPYEMPAELTTFIQKKVTSPS